MDEVDGVNLPLVRRRTAVAVGISLFAAGCLEDDGFGGSSDDEERIDYRGTITIAVDGDEVDLTQDRFQAENADDAALEFHLHESDEYWYSEGEEPVTLVEALDLLPAFGCRMEDDGLVLTIDDQTHDGREEGVEIDTIVDDETVDPAAYELEDGDDIEVRVSTNAS